MYTFSEWIFWKITDCVFKRTNNSFKVLEIAAFSRHLRKKYGTPRYSQYDHSHNSRWDCIKRPSVCAPLACTKQTPSPSVLKRGQWSRRKSAIAVRQGLLQRLRSSARAHRGRSANVIIIIGSVCTELHCFFTAPLSTPWASAKCNARSGHAVRAKKIATNNSERHNTRNQRFGSCMNAKNISIQRKI